MSITTSYVPLIGGVDLNSSALNVKPGRLLSCLNFERTYGKQGYRRIDGYERFDGRSKPSEASYWTVTFSGGTTGLVVGASLSINAGPLLGTSSGTLVQVTVTSGSLGAGTAVGTLLLTGVSNTAANGSAPWNAQTIQSGMSSVGTATSDAYEGSISDTLYYTRLSTVREYLRSLIGSVPGYGPILGLAVFQQRVIAARQTAEHMAVCSLYESTSTGWSLVYDNIPMGSGRTRFAIDNFTGDPKNIALFMVNGETRMHRIKLVNGSWVVQYAPDIYSTEGTSSTSITLNSAAPANKTYTIAGTARDWIAGDVLTVIPVGVETYKITATVVSYAHPTLVVSMPTPVGYLSGVTIVIPSINFTASLWDFHKTDDRPIDVISHKDHLFLAYPSGQLQSSNLGDPMTYTSSAALFGVGDEIVAMKSLRGSQLAVFCKSSIQMITGSSQIDWKVEPHSTSSGAQYETVQDNTGEAIFLDDRGLTTLSATNAFGDFMPTIFSKNVDSVVKTYFRRINASVIAKQKYQYRLYMDDGAVLSACLNAQGQNITSDIVEFTLSAYPDIPTCFASGDTDRQDAMFFGTANGYVMEEDMGTSFDGVAIPSTCRMHFNHFKKPSIKKRFRKMVLEIDTPESVDISFKQIFDYDDGFFPSSINQTFSVAGLGGAWDVSAWDTFQWSMPAVTQATAHIDGVGKNMGLVVWHESNIDQPFTMQGLLIHYSELGLER